MRGRSVALLLLIVLAGAIWLAWSWIRPQAEGQSSTTDGTAEAVGGSGGGYPYLPGSAGDGLFQPVAGVANLHVPVATGDRAPERIAISRVAAQQAVRTGALPVHLPDGRSFPVRYERQETSATGDWTFIGRVETALGSLAAVITFGKDGVFGVLPSPDGRMLHITTSHGESYLQPAGGLIPAGTADASPPQDAVMPDESGAAQPSAGAPPPTPSLAATGQPADPQPQASLPPTASLAPLRGLLQPAAAPTSTDKAAQEVLINVLGIYTSNLVALRGSVAAAETEFTNLVAVANQAHVDSGTVARFHLVGMRELDYPADLFNEVALPALANNTVEGLDVHALRDSLGADLVAMLRPYAPNDTSCGIAYLNGAYSNGDWGYSVTATQSCGPLVLAHEIGHNIGSHHDIETTGGASGAYVFSRGYRQHGPPAFATVMAYTAGSQSWIGYFSDPTSTSCLGASCGVAEEADNVRSINLMAPSVSRYRDPPGTISVFDAVPVFEPEPGQQTSLSFEVRLASPAPAGGVYFDIATSSSGATATGGVDYTGVNLLNQHIPEGAKRHYVTVSVLGDASVEGDETVRLTLRNVRGATLFDANAYGTILDDDPRPTISGRILPPAGMPALTSPPTIRVCSTIEVPVHTSDCTSATTSTGTYSAGVLRGSRVTIEIHPGDPYASQSVDAGIINGNTTRDITLVPAVWVSGRLRWPAGEPAPTSSIYVWAYTTDPSGLWSYTGTWTNPPDYRYRLKTSPGSSVRLETSNVPPPYVAQQLEVGEVHADVTRDLHLRRLPGLVISHVTIPENGYSAYVQLRLSAPAPAGGARFTITTKDGQAMSDNDYVATTSEVVVPEGQQYYGYVGVPIHDDPWMEEDETFSVTATGLSGVWLPADGVVRIVDEDPFAPPTWRRGDFALDGAADIVWRNATDGRVMRWDGWQLASWWDIASVADSNWIIAGIGDFNNDYTSDLLWRHTRSGRNTIWLGGNPANQRAVTDVTGSGWQVVGVGDFNGDDRSDILWRHAVSGSNVVWKSGNSATQQPVTGVTNLDWFAAGVGDFDGDGVDDILWRNRSTGANAIWRSARNSSQIAVTTVRNLSWEVAGIGDFDADGKSDIVWTNRSNGTSAIWRAGASTRQIAVTRVSNLDWRIAAVADYDGDGRADLLWRDMRLGKNAVWLSGNSRTQWPVRTLDPTWRAIP